MEIPVEGNLGTLVISGQISTVEGRTLIQIGRTAPDRLPYAVRGSTVLLIDHLENQIAMIEYDSGIYRLPGFQGVPGSLYHVEIILSTGAVYRSQPEMIPIENLPLELSYTFGEDQAVNADGATIRQKFISIYASTSLNNLKNIRIGYIVNETFMVSPTDFPDPFGSIPPPCFIDQKAEPNRIAQVSTRNITGSKIENILICKRNIDWTFLEKHYFTAYQTLLSEESFQYWSRVNTLANQTGSIFDTPPAQIRGNIQNLASPEETIWGYVQSVNETTERFVLYPYDFPFPIFFSNENCTYNPNRTEQYSQYCLNCLTMKNSTLQRPDWF
ncbi:MAG: DUF4249 family protein [Cytophagales bacterium]|nr:DUF4249 family protein [Cytophagales bacterium]